MSSSVLFRLCLYVRALKECLHRYLRALAVMYIRMTFRSNEVYEILEPLLKDYRKIRLRHMGEYSNCYTCLNNVPNCVPTRWTLPHVHGRIRRRAAYTGARV